MEVMALQVRNNIIVGLQKIETAWTAMNMESDRCLANYRKWRSCRIRTLSALRKFQEEFDKIHLYSSAGRTVGNGAALLGSLATVVGFGLSLSKNWKPIGNELMKYGSTVGTLGGATSITTSLVELGFNAQVLKEVKQALEEDNLQTELLLDWFERTNEFNTHLQEVFDCSVMDFSDIFTAIREVSVIYNKGGKTLNELRSFLSRLISNNATSLLSSDHRELETILCKSSYKVQTLLLEFCNNSAVRKATWGIYASFKRNPISLDLSKVTFRIIGKAKVHDIAMGSLLSSMDCQSLMRCAGVAARGIFRTINVALNAIAFISAVNDFKNEKSKYSKMIGNISDLLSKELEMLKSHPMLKTHNDLIMFK